MTEFAWYRPCTTADHATLLLLLNHVALFTSNASTERDVVRKAVWCLA